jgi:hypothetical protein
MKLLKRNLAFVLTLAMVLGLMVSASALDIKDYSDYNEITYLEAIDLLTSLGILEGTDGKFNPQDVLTREQGAKIIAYLMLGKDGAEALSTSVAPFKDVASGRWSAGYIAYCVSQGIIGGYGNGNFGPTDTLTGNQFAKMLLVALGYGVNGEFTGPNWSIEVAKYALTEGIFDGNLGANFDAGTKREEAALYAFNALTDVMTVSYSETFGTYYSGKLFNSVEDFNEEYTLGYKLYNVKSKDTTDDFGREAHYWVKNSNTKLTETYHDEADATYTAKVTSSKIYTDLGLTATRVATVIRNGEDAGTHQIKKGWTSSASKIGGNGVLIEAYVNDDEEVTLVLIDTYLAKVTNVEDGEVTVDVLYTADNLKLDDEKFETAVEYEEDDYVLVTIAAGDIQSMVKAESKTGTIKETTSDSVKLGDEKINMSAQLAKNTKAGKDVYVEDYDSEMRVYFDQYGYAAAVIVEEEADANYSYVLVTDSEGRTNSLLNGKAAVVEVTHLDGKSEVLSLQTKKDGSNYKYYFNGQWVLLNDEALNSDKTIKNIPNGWYRYTMTDDGEIVLKALGSKADGGNKVSFTADASQKFTSVVFKSGDLKNEKSDDKTSNFIMNSKTVLHVVDEDTNKTYTGYKNIKKTVTDGKVLFVLDKDDSKLVADIYVINTDSKESNIYAYYDGDTKSTSKDETKIGLYVDGELTYYVYNSSTVAGLDNNKDENGLPKTGAYLVELTDTDVTSMVLKATVKTKVTGTGEDYFETKTTVKNDQGQDVEKTVKHFYDEDVEIYDITDDGKAGTVAKNDYVVFVNKASDTDFVTCVYIVSAPNTTKPDEDVNDGKYSIDVQQGKAIIKGEANAEITLVVEIYGKTDYNKYETVSKTIASDGTVTYNPADEGQYKITVKDANGNVLCSESELFLKPVVNPAQ